MLRLNINIKNISNYFLKLLAIISILFSININMAYGYSNKWIEVSRTIEGKQYWDKNSLTKKDKGVIEIRTKYLKKDDNNSDKYEENIYTMEINCIKNKYKDISVNGKSNPTSKWEGPHGDKLIIDVITESCKNV